jgi:hypothetical protein
MAGESEGAQGAGAADAGNKGEKSDFTREQIQEIMRENKEFKTKWKTLAENQEKADKAALETQGKFKELHEAETKKTAALALQLKRAKFQNLALAKGITSDKIISRIDISGIDMDESGALIGADEIITDLLALNGQQQQAEQPKAKVATPGGKASVGGPATFEDFLKLPPDQRNEWAVKNPAQYNAICDQAKNR